MSLSLFPAASRYLNQSFWRMQYGLVQNNTFSALSRGQDEDEQKENEKLGIMLDKMQISTNSLSSALNILPTSAPKRTSTAISSIPLGLMGARLATSRGPLLGFSPSRLAAIPQYPQAQAGGVRQVHDHTWALTGMDSGSLDGVALVIAITGVMGYALTGLSYIFAPRRHDLDKVSAYECGFDAFGDARQQFDISFYRVCILYLLFDIEMALIMPYMLANNDWQSWNVMALFLSILVWGFMYEWRIGALEWK